MSARAAFLVVAGSSVAVGLLGLLLHARLHGSRAAARAQAGAAVGPAAPNR